MSGTAKRLAEAANHIINPQTIAEAFKNGDKVKVPHKGKMVSGRIIRYDDGGTDKARQSGGGYVVDVGEPASILVPKEKVQKEAVVTEISKATKDAYVAKRGSQLQKMTTGLDHYRNLLTGRQQANAVKGIKRATGVKEAVDPKQAEIDAKIRKMNAADAVERIKEIINSYSHDKQTKAMIIAGMKSIKESSEITEAPYTPANDYEGEMAMTQLKSIMEKASDVLGMMKPEAKMEAWVQSKITLADEHISCVRDYLKHTDGAIQ